MNMDGFIFDLDGTIYLGEQALPGAVELVAKLREREKSILYVTNKPLQTRVEYAEKLTRLGMPTHPEDILTAAVALGSYLLQTQPDLRYYVVGEESLKHELAEMGLHILDELNGQDAQQVIDPAGIQAVVVAFDRSLDYRKLNTAYQALLNGAMFFATNADKACPMPGGSIPDAGATIAALEYLTGKKMDFLAGKPSAWMAEMAQQRLQIPPERCLLVGDRLETDIRMGQRAGLNTALVLTGAAKREQVQALIEPPTLILETLYDLIQWIDD
jgi:NagD protein